MPTAPPTQTLPTTTLPTTLPTLPAPSPTPPANVKGADLGIVSITPNVTHARVGDLVTFTIVAENYGPDSGEIDVNTAKAVEGLMGGGSTSTNCGIINGPPPQPGTFGNDGSGCEDIGSFPPGTTVIDTLIALIAPTSTGVASDTACTWSAAGTSDPNPSNDCATATVTVDSTTCPAGMPGATQTVDGHTYNLEGEDTFTKDAPLGSFASTDMNGVIYTGDHGMGWTEYPDGWPSTYSGKGVEGYQPSTVQSVHDGMLDFYLHDDPNHYPVGADPSPVPGGNRYQTYGAWSFCELLVPTDYYRLYDFHQATLLWPESQVEAIDWQSAESDFPEADLNATPTVDSLNQCRRTRTTVATARRMSSVLRRRYRLSIRPSGTSTRRRGVRASGLTTWTASSLVGASIRCTRSPSAGNCKSSRRLQERPRGCCRPGTCT